MKRKDDFFFKLVLIFILILSIVFRIYHFTEISFTNDELSALSRLQYENIDEVINTGSKINDTHPAGIQTFLFFWTKWFGVTEWVVKLPFLIFGIFSLILIYVIAKQWFNKNTALLSLSFVSVLQCHVMYSQIARPYISGLFFTLLAVYFFTLIHKNEKVNYWHFIGLILAFTLSMFNHYFSFFFALLVGIAGLFFLRGKKLLFFILAGFVSAVLFLPHLHITLHHLSVGGIGWLSKPDVHFVFNYFSYLFHYSTFYFVFVILVLGVSIFIFINEKQKLSKYHLLAIGFFIIPFLTAYIYSLFGKYVLQFAVLFFSLPYFIVLLFSFVSHRKSKLVLVASFLILIIGSSTLIFSRQHYQVFAKQGFEATVINLEQFLSKNSRQDINILTNVHHPYYLDYYYEKHGLNIKSDVYDLPSKDSLCYFLEQIDTSKHYLALSMLKGTDLEIIPFIQKYYPNIVDYDYGFSYEYFLFSKKEEDVPILEPLLEKKKGNTVLNQSEFGKSFRVDFDSINHSNHDFIFITTKIKKTAEVGNPILVSSIDQGDENIDWRSSQYIEFVTETDSIVEIYLAFRLSYIDLPKKNAVLKSYIWNRDQKTVEIIDQKLEILKGNELVYSLYYPFEKMDKPMK